MKTRNLIVDGMLSGTGLRDAVVGGYVDAYDVGLSTFLTNRIANWLREYENAHYYQFADEAGNERLDQEGIAIAKKIREELPGTRVEYFSNAKMHKIAIV